MLLYEFVGFHIGVAKTSVLFWYDVASLCDWLVPDVSWRGNGLERSAES